MKNAVFVLSRQVALLIVVIACVSCAAVGPRNPNVAHAKRTFETRKTYAQGILGGAAIGAIGGVFSGFRPGRDGGYVFDKDQAVQGAAAGAAIGAVAGGMQAHRVVQARQDAAARAQLLENAISQARSTRGAASDFNRTLSREVAAMRKGDEAVAGTLADARAVLGEVQSDLAASRYRLTTAQAVSSAQRQQLAAQVNGLEGEKSELVGLINLLESKRGRSPLAKR
jgi:hypothetical protein